MQVCAQVVGRKVMRRRCCLIGTVRLKRPAGKSSLPEMCPRHMGHDGLSRAITASMQRLQKMCLHRVMTGRRSTSRLQPGGHDEASPAQ